MGIYVTYKPLVSCIALSHGRLRFPFAVLKKAREGDKTELEMHGRRVKKYTSFFLLRLDAKTRMTL